MATPEQLIQQVRFGLETLRERNGHHEFEALCLAVARRRIASNLLPATGPVSSGGDQGRDSESHWTNLPNEIGRGSAFTRLATTENLVLACTMQRDNLPGKIRGDLVSISAGQPVDHVVYFTVAPVEVSKRHELQEAAEREHGIALSVWDALALAHAIAESDLFYLAVQYLHVPSELAPPAPAEEAELPEWYLAARDRWRTQQRPGLSFGDLVALRRPLRHATFNAPARADLPEWLGHVRVLMANAGDLDVVLHCRYEIAVATLRGTNTLRPADEVVEAFFTDVLTNNVDGGLLEDAIVLGQYCLGAGVRGLTGISADKLASWHGALRDKISEMLASSPPPNTEAHLLSLAARLALQPSFTPPEDIDRALLASPQEVTERVLEMLDAEEPLQVEAEDLVFVDLNAGMELLVQLCRRLPDAPLFPMETIGDYFDLLTLSLARHPAYREVRDALDAAIARLHGEAAKADRARHRGMSFLQAGRLLEALAEIHEAKVNWWHGETLQGAVLSMLIVSDIYSRLHLPIAAKHYALAAAVVAKSSAQTELAHFVPRGLLLAASYDYQAGNWLTATHAFRVAILAQANFAHDPWNLDLHDEFSTMVTYQTMILKSARELRPGLTAHIEEQLESTGIIDMVAAILDGVGEQSVHSEEEWARIADAEGGGRPFSDTGRTRCYRWTALGMSWMVTAGSDRLSVLACERFVAAAQIVHAELATDDALLLGGCIQVEVRPDSHELAAEQDFCEPIPDNETTRWIVHLAPKDRLNSDEVLREVAAALMYVMATHSLLPFDRFREVMQRTFDRGLWHKLGASRPYDDLADVLGPDEYRALESLQADPLGSTVPVHQEAVRELAASTEPGPGYTQDAALELIRNRYANLQPVVRFTLRRLAADSEFMATARTLRGEGWRDWHLLTAIANHVANCRFAWAGLQLNSRTPETARRAMALAQRPEEQDDPQVPSDRFTEDVLRFALNGAVLSTLQILDLHYHRDTPDFDAIFDFLGRRYRYWIDDAEHPDFFGWSSRS